MSVPIQCRSDTPNPGVETEASCGRHTETWRRHKRLLAGTATADDMTFTRNLIAVERAVERARTHKLNSASRVDKIFISAPKGSIGLDAKVAKKLLRGRGTHSAAAKAAAIADEEEEERIRHNTKLLRVLARKELVDGDDSDDYGDLYMGPC